MFTKPFRYLTAASVDEACAALEEHGTGAKLIAGGQSLLPLINFGLVEPDVVVDVSRLPNLSGASKENGSLVIGALTTHRSIERSREVADGVPLLAEAVRHVGNTRVRNRGTLGGSLAHADPSAELPMVMAVLEAAYEISDGGSSRRVTAAEFPVTYFTTSLAENEMVTSVSVPVAAPGQGWGFHEFSRRPGDFALVAAAALARARGEVIEELRLGLAGVADRPVRCPAFEERARGASVSDLTAAIAAVDDAIDPVSDTGASAEYRRRLARVLALRAVEDACRRSAEAAA